MPMHNPPHPGKVLKELWMEPMGITITALAEAAGVTRKAMSELVNGKSGVSPEMAIRLSKIFNTEPELWLGMQMNRDLWVVKKKSSRIKVKRLAA
ncbi:MAG: HigA family addiction module antidote protein [Nitrospinae bacterium]|nr:HigA family addiction module antidote protein [Nitrospinota bacterium]MBF0633314.1 HigA family addiction module antidote protein [Nitrospinota bacterium]